MRGSGEAGVFGGGPVAGTAAERSGGKAGYRTGREPAGALPGCDRSAGPSPVRRPGRSLTARAGSPAFQPDSAGRAATRVGSVACHAGTPSFPVRSSQRDKRSTRARLDHVASLLAALWRVFDSGCVLLGAASSSAPTSGTVSGRSPPGCGGDRRTTPGQRRIVDGSDICRQTWPSQPRSWGQ